MERQLLELEVNHPTWNLSLLNLKWITLLGTSLSWAWIDSPYLGLPLPELELNQKYQPTSFAIHCQVTATKKRPRENKETEKVVPKTVKELAEDKMSDMLKSAGQARSASIKLTNVAYGKDLAKELLAYAEAAEGLFKALQSAMDSENQKHLQSLLQKWEEKEREGEKAKAGLFLSNINHIKSETSFLSETTSQKLSINQKHLLSETFLIQMFSQIPNWPRPSCAGCCECPFEEACQEKSQRRWEAT